MGIVQKALLFESGALRNQAFNLLGSTVSLREEIPLFDLAVRTIDCKTHSRREYYLFITGELEDVANCLKFLEMNKFYFSVPEPIVYREPDFEWVFPKLEPLPQEKKGEKVEIMLAYKG
ncbi:MAG: hypothetical protein HY929_06250 [Euryarchaeota archaeon]|nr:hypothetical protein [Euryarchaeota archaeon]